MRPLDAAARPPDAGASDLRSSVDDDDYWWWRLDDGVDAEQLWGGPFPTLADWSNAPRIGPSDHQIPIRRTLATLTLTRPSGIREARVVSNGSSYYLALRTNGGWFVEQFGEDTATATFSSHNSWDRIDTKFSATRADDGTQLLLLRVRGYSAWSDDDDDEHVHPWWSCDEQLLVCRAVGAEAVACAEIVVGSGLKCIPGKGDPERATQRRWGWHATVKLPSASSVRRSVTSDGHEPDNPVPPPSGTHAIRWP
jgi:hypothetical protein